MTLRFGTDGVRGIANADLTPELVLALGRAAARVLGQGPSGPVSGGQGPSGPVSGGRRSGPFLVGRDTRISGPLLQAALSAGLAGEGADVIDLGVLPTPGVAWLSATDGLPAAMISASHNPFPDNGVKFFEAGGRKLSDDTEARLEAELDGLIATAGPPTEHRLTGTALGRLLPADGVDRYTASLVDSVGRRSLAGLSVILDCANGAASRVAPGVLRALGADVTVLNDAPDGVNINDGCGSTHPEGLQQEVVSRGAHVGLAFDGDADRVLAVDHAGRLVDGDQIIAICAVDRQARGLLPGDTVVSTVMANLGFRQAMAAHGISLVETPVGDRYVLEEMERGGWALGGEQSGHIIFADLATTGDGTLTGLQVLDVMARTGRPLADLAGVMARLPQVLRSVPVATRGPSVSGSEDLTLAIKDVQGELGDRGRVLVRASGTEAVVRVMVEAVTLEEAEAACDVLCRAVNQALGAQAPG